MSVSGAFVKYAAKLFTLYITLDRKYLTDDDSKILVHALVTCQLRLLPTFRGQKIAFFLFGKI